MLNLEELVFKVNTTELTGAVTAVDNLGKAVVSLGNKSSSINVKVNQTTKAVKEQTQATDENAKVTAKSVTVLERQQEVLNFMAQGFSKGQASVLAYAKAAGAATDELAELGQVLDRQRTLMGTDPFDKSIGAMKALKNEFTVLKEANRLYNADLGLTKKQTEELAKEKLRLIERLKQNKASFTEVKNALMELNVAYIQNAQAENALDSRMKVRQKTIRETADANDFLAKEMERVNRLLSGGSDLTSTTNNRLIKFEQALKKSGMTAEAQATALAKYKQQLMDIQHAAGNRQVDYLSRALGPQITDIFVGLTTGQSPLMVLLQQGGQLRDQFALAGVAGKDMGNMLTTAAKSMVVSVKDIAVAVGGLMVNAFVGAGAAINNTVMSITGMDKALLALRVRMLAMNGLASETTSGWITAFRLASTAITVLSGTIAVGFVAALGVAGVALGQVIKQENELAKSLILTGGAMGLTQQSAIDYAKSISGVTISTSQAINVMTAMAKEGGFAFKEIETVVVAATQMHKYFNIAIEDTVKAYAKMKEDPVKNLIELAKATGMVSAATIEAVVQLKEQGKNADATALAIKTLADVNATQVDRMKADYNGFSLFLIELGSGIKKFYDDTFKAIFYKASPKEELKKQIGAIQEILNGGGSVAGAVARLVDEDGMRKKLEVLNKQLLKMVEIEDADRIRTENQVAQAALIDKSLKLEEQYQSTIEKHKQKIKDIQNDINDAQRRGMQGTETMARLEKALAGEKERLLKAQQAGMKSGSGSIGLESDNTIATLEKEFNTRLTLAKNFARDDLAIEKARLDAGLINQDQYYTNTIGLITKGEQQQLDVVDEFSKKYQDAYISRIQTAEKALADTYAKNKGTKDQVEKDKEALNNFLAVISNLTNSYGAFQEKIEAVKAALKSSGMVREFEAAAKLNKAIEAAAAASRKYSEESAKIREGAELDNLNLDHRLELLGKTEEQQKVLNREWELQNKLTKIQVDLERRLREIRTDKDLKNDPMGQFIAEQEAIQASRDARIVANKEVAVQAAEDYQKEFNRIRDGISDAIVTALFEGGQAGKKKLRDLLVAELRKPITLVVNALVSTSMQALGLTPQSMAGGSGTGSGLLNGITNAAGGTGVIGMLGSGISSVGSSLGFTAMADFGMGMNIGSAALSQMGGVTTAASLGSTIGAALPYVGLVLAIASMLDDSGTMHTGGIGSYSAAAGLQYGQSSSALSGYSGTAFNLDAYSQSTAKSSADIAKSIVGILDSTAKTFGKEAGYYAATGFADDTSKDGAWGQLVVKLGDKIITDWGSAGGKWPGRQFGDGEAGQTEYGNAIAKDVRNILLDSTPDWADAMLNALGDAPTIEQLASVIDQINKISSAMIYFGKVMPELANLTDEATTHLINMYGGIDGLSTALSSFYQNYYSDTEKFNTNQRLLKDSFNQLNIAMPASTAEFRKLVEAQDLNTEAGRTMYASLLNLAPAFYEVSGAIEQTMANITKTTEQSVRDIEMSILSDQEKYNYLDKEIENLITKLSEATLPSEIESLFGQINSDITSAYNLLDETQQKNLAQEFIDRFYEAQDIANSRLKANGAADAVEEQAKAVESQRKAAEDAREAAKEMLEAATQYRMAAEQMLAAANTAQTINIRVNDKATSQVTF